MAHKPPEKAPGKIPDYDPDRNYCCFPSPKTVIPGAVIQEADPQNGIKEIRQTHLYLLYESSTNRSVDNRGYRHDSSVVWRIPITGYFITSESAITAAFKLHQSSGCTSPRCGWNRG